jgi:hypothetical protein
VTIIRPVIDLRDDSASVSLVARPTPPAELTQHEAVEFELVLVTSAEHRQTFAWGSDSILRDAD